MARYHIYPDALGPEATEEDARIFEEAVERLAESEFDGDMEAAAAYLWGDGDYFERLPEDLQARCS